MQDSKEKQLGQSVFDLAAKFRVAMAGGDAGGARPAGPASYRLEPSNSNLTSGQLDGFTAVVPCKCRCRTCEKCGPVLGWRVRQNMLDKAHYFRKPAMLSLTVDRSHFESPEMAHRTITKGSFIARLMRLLGIGTWFWVLEFQTKNGNGWPHWHLMIDLADVNGHLDLSKAWGLWRDKWGLGGLDLSTPKHFEDRKHAVMYLTKYLTKMPEAFPVWVICRTRTIRFVGGCKAIGSLTGQPGRLIQPKDAEPANTSSRAIRTLLLERMARCGMNSTVFNVSVDCETGEIRWRWMASLPCPVDDLVELSGRGMASATMKMVDWGSKKLWTISPSSEGNIMSTLKQLPLELADEELGYMKQLEQRMMDRACSILDHHAGFWAARAA